MKLNTRPADVWKIKRRNGLDGEDRRVYDRAISYGRDFTRSSRISLGFPLNGDFDSISPVIIEGTLKKKSQYGVECPMVEGRTGSMFFAADDSGAYVRYDIRFETNTGGLPAVYGLVRRVVGVAEKHGLVAKSEVGTEPSKVSAHISLCAEFGQEDRDRVARLFGAIDRTIDHYLKPSY